MVVGESLFIKFFEPVPIKDFEDWGVILSDALGVVKSSSALKLIRLSFVPVAWGNRVNAIHMTVRTPHISKTSNALAMFQTFFFEIPISIAIINSIALLKYP
jgi:hypothetical protein